MAEQKTIRAARENLLQYLEEENFCGSPNNQLTVVFDGQPGIWYPKKASAIKVVFSSAETADELIKRMVAEANNKKSLYVITDDKALGQGVRGLGAKTLRIKDFFGRINSKQSSRQAAKASGQEKDISKVNEFKINDELKKIWMK